MDPKAPHRLRPEQALNNTINSLESPINESVQLALQTFGQVGSRVGDLIDCYNLMNEMVANVSIEMVEAMQNRMPLAASGLTSGMVDFDNLLNQASVAMQASGDAGQSEMQGLMNDIQGILIKIAGNPPYTEQNLINHFIQNLTNPNWFSEISQDIISAQTRTNMLSVTILNAGLSSLNSLGQIIDSANDHFNHSRNESIAVIQIFSNPPSPPMASLDLIDNPGFPFDSPQLAAGNIQPVDWQGLNISFNPGKVNLETRTLRDHLAELQSVKFREVQPSTRDIRTTGPCLTCARDFELTPVRDTISKAPPRGGVSVVVLNSRGAEVINLGSFSSIDAIPTTQRINPPRGGFSRDSVGCNLTLEVRDTRGLSLASSPVCVNTP